MMRRYARGKLPRDEARRALLNTIGSRYRGERYFELVDRVYTEVENAYIPVYDVRLSLSQDSSLEQLLNFYTPLRDYDIQTKWCVICGIGA